MSAIPRSEGKKNWVLRTSRVETGSGSWGWGEPQWRGVMETQNSDVSCRVTGEE